MTRVSSSKRPLPTSPCRRSGWLTSIPSVASLRPRFVRRATIYQSAGRYWKPSWPRSRWLRHRASMTLTSTGYRVPAQVWPTGLTRQTRKTAVWRWRRSKCPYQLRRGRQRCQGYCLRTPQDLSQMNSHPDVRAVVAKSLSAPVGSFERPMMPFTLTVSVVTIALI